MAKPNKSLFDAPGFKFDSKSGVLTIKHGGDITIIQEADGSWAYQQGANTYRISSEQASQVNAISVAKATDLAVDPAIYSEVAFSGPGSVKLDAIDYVIADADSKFEPTVNLDTSIKAWIIEDGVAAAFNNLVALTSEADAFKLLWDHLDDEYSYYNTAVNDSFIDLGIIWSAPHFDRTVGLADKA